MRRLIGKHEPGVLLVPGLDEVPLDVAWRLFYNSIALRCLIRTNGVPEALAYCQRQPYLIDLVFAVSLCAMPPNRRIMLLDGLREINPAIRCAFWTASSNHECHMDVIRHGAVGVLEKSCRCEDFPQVIGEFLSRSTACVSEGPAFLGNPFPSLAPDPLWLSWNDGTVPRMAQAIYEGKRFGDMPILHDALLDAGCDNEDILDHCRNAQEHWAGCWVLDLLRRRSANVPGEGIPADDLAVRRAEDGEPSTAYEVIRCPNCTQRLRLPRNKGELKVRCPQCRHTWDWTPLADRS